MNGCSSTLHPIVGTGATPAQLSAWAGLPFSSPPFPLSSSLLHVALTLVVDAPLSIFLAARWSNLVLVTYTVPEALVRAVVHPALELDRWEGQTHVSLVAFDFCDTRVLFCRVPGHVTFPEVNLRTYVRHGDRRGVSFIREFVPRRLVAAVARAAFNEPYRATSMDSATAVGGDRVCVTHQWRWGNREHTLTVVGSAAIESSPSDSAAYHFTEHEWGYGRTRGGRLLRYRVRHPEWSVRTVHDLTLNADFGALYGDTWAWLTDATPASVVFAVGSPVIVDRPRAIADGMTTRGADGG